MEKGSIAVTRAAASLDLDDYKRKCKPKIEDLQNHVVPKWASKWKQLGKQLNIDEHLMDIIDCDHPNDCETCCNEMFFEWLDCNPFASWEDIITAEDNLSTDVNEEIPKAANVLCECYVQSRYLPSNDDWPPYHPKHYTPLTVVHHQGRCTESEVENSAQKFKSLGTTEESYKTIEHINELFTPFEEVTPCPYIILIEGAPGIGKTILSKEIAFQWANKTILKDKKLLFLLFMRDPQVKNISDVQSLVNYFCQGNSLTNKVTDWLVETGGKYLVILLDGYDEISKENRNHFIDGIIHRQKLPKCCIIVTSRPVASSPLHNVVNCRVEVLGFNEENRGNFIQEALVGQSHKIAELTKFLLSNPSLNALCNIPLNMSILLCLTEDGISMLPKMQTLLYQKFILMTIVHFLKKDKTFNITLGNLNDLPHPYDMVVKELSQFAFLALQKDQLVFTLTEVKAECPSLTPDNWDVLGLLKSTQYFKAQDGCDHKSFHFLHYSIQEYMAAYYIASLPNSELLPLLKETFWNVHYFNTWIMYVGITGGNHFIFTHFLSGNYLQVSTWLFAPKISDDILNDKIKCLHLLHCSAEAGYGNNVMLSYVESIFQGGIIDLSNCNLSINDLRTLAVLLLKSPNKHWEMLNLSGCNIDDTSCNSLCKLFQSQNALFKIKTVDISYNNIQWESLCKFCEILKIWQVEELIVSNDALYDRMTMNLIRSFANKIDASIPTYITGKLFSGVLLCSYVAQEQKMVVVYSEPDFIQCFQLPDCILNDVCIVNLQTFISQKFGTERINTIAFSYHINYSEANDKSTILSDYVARVTLCGSNMHSKGAYLMKIPVTIQQNHELPHQAAADYVAAVLCHNTQSDSSYLKAIPEILAAAVRNILPSLVNLKIFNAIDNGISKEAAEDIETILSQNTKLQELYLGGNNLQSAGAIKIMKSLQNVTNLLTFSIPNNNIGEEAADDIATVLSKNIKLQRLQLGGNNLKSVGAMKIAKSLHNITCLTKFGISNNNIGEEAADDIAAVLSHNNKLQVLYLGGNNLQLSGIIKITVSLQIIFNLTIFSIPNNNISEQAANDIATVLSHNTKLQRLELGGNNLESVGTIKIAKGLQNIFSLTKFGISKNNFGEEAAVDVAAVLSHNTKLEELYLSGNNLQSSGTIKVTKGLQKISHLKILYLSNNNIDEEAANDIANVLYHNTDLQELYLSRNNLQSAGIIKIAKGLQNVFNLTMLGISFNNICEEAANQIAAILSNNTKLQKLYLNGNNLQSAGAIKLAKGLLSISNLITLSISDNMIGEEAAGDMAAVLTHNSKLQELYLGGNNLQSSGAIKIARGLQYNSSLRIFSIYNNCICEEAADEIAAILSHNGKLQKLDLGGNNLQSAGAIKIAKGLQNISNLVTLYISNNNITEDAADDIATVLSHNTKLQRLELGGNNLQSAGAMKIAKGLRNVSSLTIFSISNNSISEEAADGIAAVLSHNIKLQELYLGGNDLQSAGTAKIAKSLQSNTNITTFSIYNNNVGEETVDDIIHVLSHNTDLQKLDLGGNNLQSVGAIKIAKVLQKISSLTLFYISNNNISEEASHDIATALSRNTKLQKLELSGNNLKSVGAIKITKGLQDILTLTKFGISNNDIGEEAADDIAAALFHSTKLQELYLMGNNLQSAGIIKISKGLQNVSNLKIFDISNNNIGEEAADDIVAVLSHNNKLQELYLNENNLKSAGAIKIAHGLQSISNLLMFNISNNDVSEKAANDISTMLHMKVNF